MDADDQDNIILKVDEHGRELLFFDMPWAGKKLQPRFPRHGQWDEYVGRVVLLLEKFHHTADDLIIPDMLKGGIITKEAFKDFYRLSAEIMLTKAVQEDIEDIFWIYLYPDIPGFKSRAAARKWFTENAPMNGLVHLFAAITVAPKLLKKNAAYRLQKIFPTWTAQSSSATSTKKEAGPGKGFTSAPSFA